MRRGSPGGAPGDGITNHRTGRSIIGGCAEACQRQGDNLSLSPVGAAKSVEYRCDKSVIQGNDVYIAIHLVLEGVKRLHAVTAALQQEAVAPLIPTKTLLGELEAINTQGSAWLDVADFRKALKRLEKTLPALEVPLVFSNGDYNPGNFLFAVDDGMNREELNHSIGNPGSLANIPHRLSGMVDFSWACFEDPHIGFTKYWTYDWFPAGMIERYLYINGLSAKEFAPRLALRCLWTLQRELEPPQSDPHPNWYRDNLLGLLQSAMGSF